MIIPPRASDSLEVEVEGLEGVEALGSRYAHGPQMNHSCAKMQHTPLTTHTHVYMYMYVYLYIYIYMCVCMCVYIYDYICVCVCSKAGGRECKWTVGTGFSGKSSAGDRVPAIQIWPRDCRRGTQIGDPEIWSIRSQP